MSFVSSSFCQSNTVKFLPFFETSGESSMASDSPDPPTQSPSPTADHLADLAARGSWRSVLDEVGRARALSLLHDPADHLTFLAFNALALAKLRRFSDAMAELDSLGDLDSPDYRYETYPEAHPDRTGSMVPFSLRWLRSVVPIKLGKRQDGLDRLYLLLDFVRSRLSEGEDRADESRVWRKRDFFVTNSIIGVHLSNKEFSVSLSWIRDLMNRGFSDPILVSKLGYVQMQIGDIEGAKRSFDRVEAAMNGEEKGEWEIGELKDVEFANLVNRNRALVYLVGKDYVSAVREYDQCIERDNSDAVAINNKALCLMYLRDLSDSIKALESALERVPTAALDETLVTNLCSMYELAYVNHSDIKRTLSSWIARVAPDDFDSSCTRV